MTTYILNTGNARERMVAVWHFACQYLELGKAVRVDIKECKSTRSLEQNAMLHAICEDIARQRQWAGRWIDKEGWKRLLVDAWARSENRQQGDLVPSLDGASVVNLAVQTRTMSIGDMADLITFAQSWAVDNDVRLRDVAPVRDQQMAAEVRRVA